MAIITVRSSTGFPYAFNIAGSTPTPEEQIRIDTFLAEKNAGLAALAAEQTPAEGDKEEAGFLDTIGLGGTQIKGAFGTVLEETGKLVGSDDMRRYGRSVQGQARDDMYEKLINMPELKEYDDIKGIGDAFTFAKQQAGMQAANLGISLTGTIGGTIAGGAAGTAVPIVGNVAGAIAGGIAGGALASAPLLYASNINRQKSEYAKGNIDKIDQWGALRATVGQAAMEGLADRFLIGKFIGPSQFKNIFVRGTVGLGTGAALEGLTEAGQQLIERYQAGLDISSDEAIEEYLSSAAAGAVLGGGIGGLGGVLSKSSAKIKQEQLDRDLIASENDFKARVEKANKPILQLPAPETTLSLPTPTRLALPAPSPDARYNQTEMDAVTAALEDGKKLTIPSIQKILRGLRKDKVPLQDARDILSELERRGAVEGNAKAPTTVDGKGEFVSPAGAGRPVNYYPERSIRKEIDALKTEVEKDTDSLIKLNEEQRRAEQTGLDIYGNKKNANTVIAEIAKTQEGIATKQKRIVDATEQLAKAKEIYDTPTSDYVPIEAGRKLGELADAPIEVIADRLEAQKNDLANSANTLNRAKRRSTSLKKKKKLTDVEQAELDNLSGVIGRLATKVASLAEVSTKTPEQIKQQAQFERNRQNAQADEQQTILDNKARAAQARAILEQASATQAPTFSYNQKQRDVLSKLRQRLSNLGIKDIKLQAVAGTKIDGNGNLVAESEGSFSAMNKLITLSMSMYDPNLTPQQLFNSLSEVMNHEVIHALSEAGVLTNSELKILARSVRGTKYTTMVDGKLTKRMYSYFDRAERLYPTYSTDKAKDGLPSMLEEEAIAEMFRDYLAGRLTKKEIPSSIFQKMKNFFMALMKSHAESGFDSVDKIFEGIRRGEIGARERQISPREQITDQSGVKLSATPNESRSFVEGYEGNSVLPKMLNSSDELVDPDYVYRTMSRKEYNEVLNRGELVNTNGRTHASASPLSEFSNNVDDTVTVRIKYDKRDGWKAKSGLDEVYAVTDQPISSSKIELFQVAIEDTLNEQDQQDAKTIVDGQRLSAIPVPLVPSPIKKADGSMSYIYGIMEGMDRKKKFVTFPEGNHQEFSAGNTKGEGMQHIVARGHDKELMQYSKYPSVQQAVYDMIYRFTNTQKGNGNAGINPITGKENDIISYRSHGGNLTLEWRNNRGYGAKYPLLLALHERKTNGVDHYGVHTFYPIVERAKTKFSAIPQLKTDNPAGSWLEGKIEWARKDRAKAEPDTYEANLGNVSGVTGWFEEPLNLDPKMLATFKGSMGEEKTREISPKLKRLQNDIEKEGYKPEPITIHVREDGVPFIVEGNHRVVEAVASGRQSIPVEIRYLRGAEAVAGPLNPNILIELQKDDSNARETEITDIARGEKTYGLRRDRTAASDDSTRPDGSIRYSRTFDRNSDKRIANVDDLNRLADPSIPIDVSIFKKFGWAILTATRENLNPEFKERLNKRANERLSADLNRNNIPFIEIGGVYKGEDQGVSFMILSDKNDAMRLGKLLGQESVLTNEGLLYTQRVQPNTPLTGKVTLNRNARKEMFYSYTQDGRAFSTEIDWSTGAGVPVLQDGYFFKDTRPQLPVRKDNGMVELHHWSSNELAQVDPAFAGTGPYRDASRQSGNRSYFGINPREDYMELGTGYVKEPYLGSNEHIGMVDPDTLYPWFQDPDGLTGMEFTGEDAASELAGAIGDMGTRKSQEYEKSIRNAGYTGFYVTDDGSLKAPLGNVAVMFESVPVQLAGEISAPPEGSRELLSAIPQFLPKIPLAPEGVTAHRLPNILLTNGNGEAPLYPITQSFTFENEERNNQLTTDARRANPKPLSSIGAWKDLMQEAFGGDYIPTPPLIAMKYANSVDEVVNKIRKLTPDLKDGVDRGFEYVKEIRRMYETGEALPQMTMQLFIWGILSRGAGPMAQEAAYIDIINDAMPFVEKALREPLTLLDVNNWTAQIAGRMPTIKKEVNGKIVNVPDPDYTGEITGSVFANSPAKTVTMNINAAGRLVSAMSQFVGNSNRTVIDMIHEDMMDQNVSASDIRRTFLSKTKGAGIDNKVLSFILLVSGRDDVLVMDRIQGRHMWDDGRYGGANIYDGIGPKKDGGLNGIFTGPPGLMITEAMEDAIRPNVREAYRILGRPDDGTLGRFHWETWVIDGEQVVDHSTLGAIINNSPIGFSVTEGKTDVYASQGRYIRTKGGSVMEYPTPNGPVYMTPTRFKEFTLAISKDANRKKSKTGIFKTDLTNGNFLVTARADIPWFNRPEINRDALYLLAEEFENADSNGEIFESNAGLGKNEKSVPTRISRNPRERNAEQRAAVSGREGSKYGTVIPQRGEGANEAAMAAFDEQLSAIYVSSNSGAQTPNVGPRDLMRHFEDLRYTGVTDFISSTLKNVGVKVFRVNPETEKKIESNTIGFISKLQDDMLPVGIMYDKLRKAYGSIPQAYDAYFKEQLYHGIIEPLVMKFRNDVSTPLIKRIATLKLTPAQTQALANISPYYRKVMGENRYNSYAAANAFLYASHAKERNRRIKQLSRSKDVKGSGMPDTEADAILAWVRGLSPQQRADFDFIKLSARNIVKQTNDVYIKGDLIPDYLSQDVTLPDGTVEAFTEYSDYVPLTGFADADQEAVDTRGGGGGKAAFGALSKPNRSAVGRESYAGDILANLFHQYEAAIPKAERNKVGLAFLKLLESDIPTDGYAQVLQTRPMKKAISNGRIRYVPDRDFDKKYDPDDANSPIMAVRRGGKEVLIGIHDRRIASAMKGSTAAPVAAHPIVNGLHAFTRTYANLLTTWNPEFMLGNLPRDIETAIVNSQQFDMQGTGKHILKKVGPAIKQIYLYNTNRKDPNNYWQKRYEQFYNGGGQNVLNQMSSSIKKTQDVRKIIDEIVIADKGGNRARVKQLFTGETNSLYASFNALIEANGAVENGTRLAFFDAMMTNLEAQGVPTDLAVERAAFHARNLTTNFAKGGEYKNGFNTAYLFFNASLQGSMALLNAMVNSKKVRKAIAGIVVLGFASDMINAILSSDDDDDGIKDYDTINEYTLSHNFLFPDVFGTGENLKIPLGYGLNTFFNSGRVLSNLLRGTIGDKGTYDASQAAASVVGTIGDLINPFGGSNKWNWIVPTQLDLPFELITNKNFMNQPIYKELSPYEQYSSASNLYWSTTSPSAIWISKFINSLGGGGEKIPGTILGQRVDIQPDVIEHIVEFLSGGVGRFAMRSLDTATNTLPSALMGQWEDDMINKTPFLSKYLQTVTDKDKAGKYYENRDEILSVRAEIKNAQQSGDIESVRDVIKRYPEEVKLIGFVNAIENSLRKLRTVKKKIGLSTKISEEDKKTRIKAIDDRISALISRANMRMEE
jgi:hypothetical protein